MSGHGALHEFASPAALATALAQAVAAALREAIAARGHGFLAVSGGTTPGLFLRSLSSERLDWARVTVTLADERFVPETSARSNAALVSENLLQNEAARAHFIAMYRDAGDAESAAADADAAFRALPWPLDVVVLGMGGDGHTASFFPDADTLPALLDPAGAALVLPVHATSAGEPRLTLTLPAIVSARLVVLHIEGPQKKAALDAALNGLSGPPIRAVFDHAERPVNIYWAT